MEQKLYELLRDAGEKQLTWICTFKGHHADVCFNVFLFFYNNVDRSFKMLKIHIGQR